jgi:hypothetical protein
MTPGPVTVSAPDSRSPLNPQNEETPTTIV